MKAPPRRLSADFQQTKSSHRFIEILVTDVARGTWHVVAPYVDSLPEAFRMARATWPDKEKWHMEPLNVHRTKRLVCYKCGRSEVVAFGHNAANMSKGSFFRLACALRWSVDVRSGWQYCPVCSGSYDIGQSVTRQWREILQRIELGGNDGADVYEADEFYKHTIKEHGDKAKAWLV